MAKVRPLHPNPALLLQQESVDGEDKKFLVISDLHLGFESELGARGVTFDSDMIVQEMINDILGLFSFHNADGIILLGDIKNSITSITKQEWDKIPFFFNSLAQKADVYLVPGNHDGNIRFLTPGQINIISSRGMVIDDTLLVHGHVMPSGARHAIKRIVMGHVHPVFLKKGSVVNGQRVWLYMKAKKEFLFPESKDLIDIIVVPSFNRYLYSLNERVYRRSISPIIKRIIENNCMVDAMVMTLDGSIIGGTDSIRSIV